MGAVDFLWAAAVLHVLSKADCAKFITNVKLLLKPGGGFYGWTVGNTEAGDWVPTPDGKDKRYLHSMVSILERGLLPSCAPICCFLVKLTSSP